MDALSVAAASGIRARMQSLEMLANNIANQSTPGYKSDREFYSLYLAPEALEASRGATALMPPMLPVIARHWTDLSQGALTSTGSPLDVALSGSGFFVVNGPSGPLYTRNGNFRLSPQGDLETQEGYPVLDQSMGPIQVDTSRAVEIARDGSIRQEGVLAGVLNVVQLDRPEVLEKQAGTYFRLTDSQIQPQQATDTEMYQGKLESSNFSPGEAAVRLVAIMRQFEMLQRAMTLGSEMNRQAVEQVARVGS